jgi:hypothetical protein
VRRCLYELQAAFVLARPLRLRRDGAEVAPRPLLRPPCLPQPRAVVARTLLVVSPRRLSSLCRVEPLTRLEERLRCNGESVSLLSTLVRSSSTALAPFGFLLHNNKVPPIRPAKNRLDRLSILLLLVTEYPSV